MVKCLCAREMECPRVVSYCVSGEYNAISFLFFFVLVMKCICARELQIPCVNEMGLNELAWEVWGLKMYNSLG